MSKCFLASATSSFLIWLLTSPLAAQSTAAGPLPAQNQEQLTPYLKPQLVVPIGDGRTVNVVCLGEGSPTVVLTAGLGGWSQVWYRVQGAVSHTTRTCAWDPAGLGFSSASSETQDAVHETRDLEKTLATAHITGPYVLVAHSAGALVAILFADRHPGDVAGMVLLDPAIPDQAAIRQRIAPKWGTPGTSGPAVEADRLRQCVARIKSGAIKRNTPEFNECTAQPLPPEFSALSTSLALLNAEHPARLLTQASALTSVNSESPKEAINPNRRYGDLPLVVLTAGQHPFPPDMPADVRQQIEQYFKALAAGHRAYAALSTRGRSQIVQGAAHFIQFDDPAAVIEAISSVLADLRKKPAISGGVH